MFWSLRHCDWTNMAALTDYLKSGWAPFAVSDIDGGSPTIWLRKPVPTAAQAGLNSVDM